MKHLILLSLLSAMTAMASAQDVTPAAELSATATPVARNADIQQKTATPGLRFGYLSYSAALKLMPDYIAARRSVDDLRAKYDAEMKRVEAEFNQKYEQFLEGQRDFAPSILQKRQAELQDLMDKNIAFKQKAQQLLKNAENEAYTPVYQKLDAAIQRVGHAQGLAFILNTDEHAVPYINTLAGTDVTDAVVNATK